MKIAKYRKDFFHLVVAIIFFLLLGTNTLPIYASTTPLKPDLIHASTASWFNLGALLPNFSGFMNDFVSTSKQIGVNFMKKTPHADLSFINFQPMIQYVDKWFYGTTGIHVADITIRPIANAIGWVYSFVAGWIRRGIALF